MCKTYSIDFVKPPCTSHCGRHLTARIRPCKHPGTPSCFPEPNHKIEVLYRCALHLQMTVYPRVMQFTQAILTHTLPPSPGGTGGNITKFSALDDRVRLHIRQFGYCTYVAYQEEYYEAARTETYMRLHHGHLPQGVAAPPRTHGQILRELAGKLQEALDRFCDGERYVRVGVPVAEQPEAGRGFFAYPIIGDDHFVQQVVDVREGRACHYTFADIFDGLGWTAMEQDEGDDSPTLGGDGGEDGGVDGGEAEVAAGERVESGQGGHNNGEGEPYYFVSDDDLDAGR
ncbi:hypothetical protein C8A01DRAFT_37572 [Parachaetomium inaequale]|uniref:Uncharacterized protein n=1 Tax=Parachaetomium inaequale TaxID=2588326 RepID=A0AAN6PEE8_9PEZI|nr:hypothetical protein C8A01DRAFT_37572 [Parachaetomium inaequale]